MIALCLSLAGCATNTNNWANSPVDVRKNSPVVYIHPMDSGYQEASLGVLPFQVPANMSKEHGRGVGILFKDVLLGRRAFPRILRIDQPFGEISQAVEAGRRAGVDLVLAGRVNYALEGTQFGGARVEVATRLVNVHTGNTVWYIEQAMDQPMDYPTGGTLRRFVDSFNPPGTRASQGGPVVPNMLAQVAYDMADVISGAATVAR